MASSPISRRIPRPGVERGDRPIHLRPQERAGMDARVAAQGLSPLADDGGAARLAEGPLPADRLPGRHLLLGPQGGDQAKSLDEVDPGTAADLREARHSAEGAGDAAGVEGAGAVAPSRSTRSSTASRSRRRSKRSWPRRASSSARSARRCRTIRSWCRSTWARSCPTRDNFFATLNTAVFTDGSFVYIPKGVRCPMEL